MKKFIAILVLVSLFLPAGLLYLPAYGQQPLKDIKGHSFSIEIQKLWERGLIKGYPDGTFRPEANISRAEVSVLLAQANRLSLSRPAVSPFRDVPFTHWAYSYIVALKEKGIITGYPDGTFKPDIYVTRSELSVLLFRAKGLNREMIGLSKPVVLANDEFSIPSWASGAFYLGYLPQHQFLTYRPGRLAAPLALATRGEVAYGVHALLYPPKSGGTVNIALHQEPDTLSIWTGFMTAMNHILGAINIPGIGRGEGWVLYPGYITEIPTVENGQWKIVGNSSMEMTFTLREGLVWSNGKKAIIEDWAYSLMVFMDPLTPVRSRLIEEKIDFTKGAGAYGIKGFDILDSQKIRFYFKDIDWKANTNTPGVGLYPKEILEPVYKKMKETGVVDHFIKDENLSRKPTGMGPYRLVDWKPGIQIVMERNPFYPWGVPLAKTLVFRFIPDTTALLARAISGKDVDATIMGTTFDQALALEARPASNLKVFFSPGTFVEHIAFNLDNSILSDLRVRKALAYGLDREKIVKEFYGSRVSVSHSYFNTNHWAYDSNVLVRYPYDPERARNLLEEAGWKIGSGGIRVKDGVKLTVELRTTSGHSLREKIQAFIQQQWKDIGVEMRIYNLPSTTFFSRTHYTMRTWPSMLMLSMPFEPLFIGETVWRGDQIPTDKNNWSGSNIYGYKNAEVTQALKDAERELRESERQRLLSIVQRYVSDELPILPINYTVGVSLYKTNLTNYRPLGLGPITWNVHFWYFR